MRFLQNDGHIGHWNKIESPEIDSRMNGQLILNKGTKVIQ